MLITRRGFLTGLTSLAAPVIIRRPGLLMPVKAIVPPAPVLRYDPVLFSILWPTIIPHEKWRIIGVQAQEGSKDAV